ncbi:MAG TPA: hypothetical protein VGX68_22325 [Thermoanaerobaculia bacterium]|jgi:hypothetical protein|nr:hypothetical protein [Thermoanaerobaculia bacterium]
MNERMASDFDYDLRQYGLMRDRLEAYEAGTISLHKLIEDLRDLLEALEHVSPAWRQDFRKNWWTLEQIYAAAIDREQLEGLTAESHLLIAETIYSLHELVLKAINALNKS